MTEGQHPWYDPTRYTSYVFTSVVEAYFPFAEAAATTLPPSVREGLWGDSNHNWVATSYDPIPRARPGIGTPGFPGDHRYRPSRDNWIGPKVPLRKYHFKRYGRMSTRRPQRKLWGRRTYRHGFRPIKRRKRSSWRGGRNVRSGGFLGTEVKFLDTAWNSVALATSTDGAGGELQPSTGCTNCLSAPAQGDAETEHDGRKYQLISAHISGTVQTSPAANQADAIELFGYYLALVQDKQANAATIESEEVFINPSTLSSSIMPYPLRNLQNVQRFRVLDSVYIHPGGAYSMGDGTNTASINAMSAQAFKLSWKGKINVHSEGTTADVASVTDNALHLIGYAGATNLTPTIHAKCRIRFIG